MSVSDVALLSPPSLRPARARRNIVVPASRQGSQSPVASALNSNFTRTAYKVQDQEFTFTFRNSEVPISQAGGRHSQALAVRQLNNEANPRTEIRFDAALTKVREKVTSWRARSAAKAGRNGPKADKPKMDKGSKLAWAGLTLAAAVAIVGGTYGVLNPVKGPLAPAGGPGSDPSNSQDQPEGTPAPTPTPTSAPTSPVPKPAPAPTPAPDPGAVPSPDATESSPIAVAIHDENAGVKSPAEGQQLVDLARNNPTAFTELVLTGGSGGLYAEAGEGKSEATRNLIVSSALRAGQQAVNENRLRDGARYFATAEWAQSLGARDELFTHLRDAEIALYDGQRPTPQTLNRIEALAPAIA